MLSVIIRTRVLWRVQIAFTTIFGLSCAAARRVAAARWRAACLIAPVESLAENAATFIREIYMVIRLVVSRAAVGLVAMGLGVAVSGEAFAQANVLKECGSRYQAKKAANELGGQSWQEFLKECRATLTEAPAAEAKPAESTPAETAKPAEPAKPAETAAPAEPAKPAEAAKPAEPAKPAEAAKPADARAATQARQKKCAAEWKAQKAELLKSDKKLTWPKYWSACNKRLKEAGE